jgi:hypothetical protein
MGVGCADDAIEACVCAVDPVCCESGWDELCVLHVEQAGCGGCTFGPSSTDFGSDCCIPSEDPGCPDEMVSACVCESDPFCCKVQWDELCVDGGIAAGCMDCGEQGSTGEYGGSTGVLDVTTGGDEDPATTSNGT